jgi:multiple sugar transport system ATP-binding protein
VATISLQGVTKLFGKTRAVDDLTLTVNDGEFFVLLGPSGAGKTTILSLIAGLEPPDTGEIFLGSDNVTRVDPWKRDVAMAFESYALYPHMTVFESIAFPLRSPARSPRLSEAEIKAKVQGIAEMLQIGHLLERAPSQLSGGQRQRTSLGRMLVRQPRAFLMDEPIVHLDAKLRHHMRGELKQLHQQFRVTTLYATPDWVEAVAIGNRIAVLNRGRIVQIGTPNEIYNTPANRFVADFVGEPPINILRGQVIDENGGLFFNLAGQYVPLGGVLASALKQASGDWEIGVRPSAVRLHDAPRDSAPIKAEVYVSEPLGRDTIIETRVADQTLTVRAPGLLDMKPGDPVWLEINPDQILAFDRGTGVRLRTGDAQRPMAQV